MFTLNNGATIENLTLTNDTRGEGFVFARLDYPNRTEYVSWRLSGYADDGSLYTYSGDYYGTRDRDAAARAYGKRVRDAGHHVG